MSRTREPIDPASLRSILIVKPSSLGDIVHTLPLLALLRKAAPEAHISWVVNTIWAPLLQDHPLLDEVIEFPRHRFKGIAAAPRFAAWVMERAGTRPDLAIDVQGLFRSQLIAHAHRPRRILGYSDAREGARFLCRDRVDASQARTPHAVDRYLTVCPELGIPIPEKVKFPLPPGKLPEAELPEGALVLHPFSRGAGKSLSVAQVETLVNSVTNRPLVLVGRADEAESLRLPDHVVNLLNRTTLAELIGVLRHADAVVSVDSGPMHLAAALTDRLLSLHSWSNPVKVGPWNGSALAWKDGVVRSIAEWREDPPGDDARGSREIPDSIVTDIVDVVTKKWPGEFVSRP